MSIRYIRNIPSHGGRPSEIICLFKILLCVLQPRWERLNKITIYRGTNSQEKCDKYHMQFFKKSNITNMIVHNSTVWNGSIECMTPSVTQPITNHLDNWHFMMILTYLSLCYVCMSVCLTVLLYMYVSVSIDLLYCHLIYFVTCLVTTPCHKDFVIFSGKWYK